MRTRLIYINCTQLPTPSTPLRPVKNCCTTRRSCCPTAISGSQKLRPLPALMLLTDKRHPLRFLPFDAMHNMPDHLTTSCAGPRKEGIQEAGKTQERVFLSFFLLSVSSHPCTYPALDSMLPCYPGRLLKGHPIRKSGSCEISAPSLPFFFCFLCFWMFSRSCVSYIGQLLDPINKKTLLSTFEQPQPNNCSWLLTTT